MSDCYLPRVGGIETNVCQLAQRQRFDGHEVTIITSTRAPALGEGPGVIRVDRVGSHPGRIGYRRSARVRSLVVAGRYDVVHVHASTFSPLAYLAAYHAARRGIPVVLTVHSLWASATPIFQLSERIVRWSGWPVEWTAVSRAAAAPIRRVLDGRAPVTIVPNGVDPDPWRVSPIVGPRRQLRIAAVGRLAPRKRTMHLARLLLDARRRLPSTIDLSVEIVGDGPERRALERYLRRHGMTDWVHLRGNLQGPQIRAVFARSDLFVAPAILESFGIAALEARCAGLPVLARAGTGVEEYVDDGVHGWLVDSDRAMAERLADLAQHRDGLVQVAARVRGARPDINWPMVLDRYEAVYRTAAARHGSPWPVDAPEPQGLVPVSAK